MFFNRQASFNRRIAVLSVAVLFAGYIFLGGVLAIYQVSWFIWLGTQAVVFYLSWVGTGAIALAITWIVALIWAGALSLAWPQSIPWLGMFPWAASLLLIGLIASLLAVASAYITQLSQFKTLAINHAYSPLGNSSEAASGTTVRERSLYSTQRRWSKRSHWTRRRFSSALTREVLLAIAHLGLALGWFTSRLMLLH